MTSVLSEPTPSVGAPRGETAGTRPAQAPVAAAAASRAAVVLALIVVALGVSAIRDALVDLGWIGGASWLRPVIDVLDGLRPATWTVAAGAILGVLGLILVVTAVLPRRKTALPVAASTTAYLHRADVPKLANAAAREVPGVLDARSSASARKVVVRCRVTGHAQELRQAVADAVAEQLDILRKPHRVVVRVRKETKS